MKPAESLLISTNDEALEHLSVHVANISRGYGELSDDISQSCWVRIFKHLAEHGSTPLAQLIVHARYAAIDEANDLLSHGMRPLRSKHARPVRQRPTWVAGGKDTSDEWVEPSEQGTAPDDDMLQHLRSICQNEQERLVVDAGAAVAEDHAQDHTVQFSISELIRRTGLTRAEIQSIQRKLSERSKA